MQRLVKVIFNATEGEAIEQFISVVCGIQLVMAHKEMKIACITRIMIKLFVFLLRIRT